MDFEPKTVVGISFFCICFLALLEVQTVLYNSIAQMYLGLLKVSDT